MKQYNYNDNFEMVYLRHEYLEKIDNLKSIDVSKHRALTELTARKMYNKMKYQFNRVGFQEEDIVSTTYVYLVAYLGLYSYDVNEVYFNRFIDKYKAKNGLDSYPSKEEIGRVERNNIINFLRQRLYHCATLCSRKSKNITVGKDISVAFAKTKDTTKDISENSLIDNYKKFNYRKVTKKELKQIKDNAKKLKLKNLQDEYGFQVIEVNKLDNGISTDDYQLLFEDYECVHYQTPHKFLEQREDSNNLDIYKDKFHSSSNEEKKKILSKFIKHNTDNKYMSDELKQARKMLRQYRAENVV